MSTYTLTLTAEQADAVRVALEGEINALGQHRLISGEHAFEIVPVMQSARDAINEQMEAQRA